MNGMRKNLSQLDGMETLRSSHDDGSQSFRTINGLSSVPSHYSRVAITYNTEGSVTKADFFGGLLPEIRTVRCVEDVAGSLNNTYFTLYTEYDKTKYYIWYNVSGAGVDPAPSGLTGIEIPIIASDTAEFVALTTEIVLRKIEDIGVQRVNELLTITNKQFGTSTNSSDFGTGFAIITLQNGTETLIKSIQIPFDGTVRYLFNEQERYFEVAPFSDITVTVSAGQSIMVGTEDGTTTGTQHVVRIGSDLNVRVKDEDALVQLQSINTNLVNLNIEALTEPTNPDNILIVGVDNGLKTGNKYAFIYNQRQQILATQDRQQDITYADFGTKNQRVTQIDYTSSLFPGITARKIISYTLISSRYRRDSIDWSIV